MESCVDVVLVGAEQITPEEDSELKDRVCQLLITMGKQFDDFYELYLDEIQKQLQHVENVLEALQPAAPNQPKREDKNEVFLLNRIQVLKSNILLEKKCSGLKENLNRLNDLLQRLANDKPLMFVVEQKTNKTIDYFAFKMEHVCKYFDVQIRRMAMKAHQFKVEEPGLLESYQKLITPSTLYEREIMECMQFCKNIQLKDEK